MPAKKHKVRMTVDALHVLEQVAHEADSLPFGIRFGVAAIHGMLQKVAKRASELDDPELNYAMLYMHLYDVEDTQAAMDEMEELMKKKAGAA